MRIKTQVFGRLCGDLEPGQSRSRRNLTASRHGGMDRYYTILYTDKSEKGHIIRIRLDDSNWPKVIEYETRTTTCPWWTVEHPSRAKKPLNEILKLTVAPEESHANT